MTLEEAIQLADSGDVSAMNSLGDYYYNKDSIIDAYKWYSISANAGDSYGTLLAMKCEMMFAITSPTISQWKEALTHCELLLNGRTTGSI